MMFSGPCNDQHHRISIANRLRDLDNAVGICDNTSGIGDNASGIGNNASEIGDNASGIGDNFTEIGDDAVGNPLWKKHSLQANMFRCS